MPRHAKPVPESVEARHRADKGPLRGTGWALIFEGAIMFLGGFVMIYTAQGDPWSTAGMVIGFMGAALVGAGICVLMAVTGHGKEPDPVEDDRVDWIRVERGESTATPELSPDFDPPIASMNPK